MTPQNLQDYVKRYDNFIDQEIIDNVLSEIKDIEWREHQFYEPASDRIISYDHELSISFSEGPYAQKLNERLWYAIEQYIIKDFESFEDWFSCWSGYSQVRFNKYDPTTKMKLHCDHIHTLFDGNRRGIPILTILGALNDDYEGGEFMMFGNQQVDMPAGSVLIFPSNFMYPHEVKPVKSGVRYSYVSWAW